MDLMLFAIRAIHITATVAASGVIYFRQLVAEPAFRNVGALSGAPLSIDQTLDRQLTRIFTLGLLIAVVSGAGWFAVVVATIGERPVIEMFTDDVAWQVLTATQFGHAWMTRLAIGIVLAGISRADNVGAPIFAQRLLSVGLAAGLLGSLAWAGHSGAAPGAQGSIYLVADFLHLVAAGVWVGGLVPLALLFLAIGHLPDKQKINVAITATHRFSSLGVAMVATILTTGIINTWNLSGGIEGLLDTTYGHLLLVKIALFLVMFCVAAINRFKLSPQLERTGTLRQLERNCLIEAALGLLVLFTVAALGILPPAMHMDMHQMP